MNIKSLLLGSAAALVAVSGARAADAVVIAEPEPMEYVRICDTYGVGFYYIPGTETCLKVSGYMRYDIGVGSLGMEDVLDKQDVHQYLSTVIDSFTGGPALPAGFGNRNWERNDTYYKRARFALRLDARTETEMGTLRVYSQINFQNTTGTNGVELFGNGIGLGGLEWTDADDSVVIEHAYLELGGFRAGKTDSFFSTFLGYAGNVINDTIVGYGPFGTHQLSYTWNGGNGFSAGVALETGGGNISLLNGSINSATGIPPIGSIGLAGILSADAYTIDSYVPHITGGVSYVAGWGGVGIVAGYDSVWEVGSIKGRVDFNATDALTLFGMAGWRDYDTYNVLGIDTTPTPPLGVVQAFAIQPNYYGNWGGDWALWAGGTFKATEKAAINVQVSYDDAETFGFVANVNYEVVPNFVVTPELVYSDNFATDDADAWGGFLRLQSNFGG